MKSFLMILVLSFPLLSLSFASPSRAPEELNLYRKWVENSWALKNHGQTLRIDLGPARLYEVQGRLRMDLGLPNQVTEVYERFLRSHRSYPSVSSLDQEIIFRWSEVLESPISSVIVAVFDTGVDVFHPLLQSHILKKTPECQEWLQYIQCLNENSVEDCRNRFLTGVQSDADQNGYPLDCAGWSFADNHRIRGRLLGSPDTRDHQGHGTHVAGLVRLINPAVKILPIRVLGERPGEPLRPFSLTGEPPPVLRPFLPRHLSDFVALAMIYAAQEGAKIFQMSLGWPPSFDTPFFLQTLKWVQNQGIIVVAASGNDNTQTVISPCVHQGVICVGAFRNDGAMAHFSNFGPAVDVTAPGVNIWSLWPQSMESRLKIPGLQVLNGTSQAAPWVSGLISLFLGAGYDPHMVFSLIYEKNNSSELKPDRTVFQIFGSKREVIPDKERSKNSRLGRIHVSSFLYDLKSYFKRGVDNRILGPVTLVKRQEVLVKPQDPTISFFIPLRKNKMVRCREIVSLFGNITPFCRTVAEKSYLDVQIPWTKVPALDSQFSLDLEDSEGRSLPLLIDVRMRISQNEFPPGTAIIALPRNFSPDSVWIPLKPPVGIGESTPGDYLVVSNLSSPSLELLRTNSGGVAQTFPLVLGANDFPSLREMRIQEAFLFHRQGQNFLMILWTPNQLRIDANLSSRLQIWRVLADQVNLISDKAIPFQKTVLGPRLAWYRDELGWPSPIWIQFGLGSPVAPNPFDRWRGSTPHSESQLRVYVVGDKGEIRDLPLPIFETPFEVFYFEHLYLLTIQIEPRSGDQHLCLRKFITPEGRLSEPQCSLDRGFGELARRSLSAYIWLNGPHRYELPIWVTPAFPNHFLWASWLEFPNIQFFNRRLSIPFDAFDANLALVGALKVGSRPMQFLTMTNSELQFYFDHHGKPWSRSLERYSFFPSQLFVALHFPWVLKERLFTFVPEGARLGGVKWVGPYFHNSSATTGQLIAPIHLRWVSSETCRSVDSPFQWNQETYWDWICGEQILRVTVTPNHSIGVQSQ